MGILSQHVPSIESVSTLRGITGMNADALSTGSSSPASWRSSRRAAALSSSSVRRPPISSHGQARQREWWYNGGRRLGIENKADVGSGTVSGGFAIMQPNNQLSINAVEGFALEDFSAEVRCDKQFRTLVAGIDIV